MAEKNRNKSFRGEKSKDNYTLHELFRVVGDQLTAADVKVMKFLYRDVVDKNEYKVFDGYTFFLAMEKCGKCDESNFKHLLHLLRIITRHDLTEYVRLRRRKTGWLFWKRNLCINLQRFSHSFCTFRTFSLTPWFVPPVRVVLLVLSSFALFFGPNNIRQISNVHSSPTDKYNGGNEICKKQSYDHKVHLERQCSMNILWVQNGYHRVGFIHICWSKCFSFS